jgi:hypothetical protein
MHRQGLTAAWLLPRCRRPTSPRSLASLAPVLRPQTLPGPVVTPFACKSYTKFLQNRPVRGAARWLDAPASHVDMLGTLWRRPSLSKGRSRYRSPADLFLMDLERVAVRHFELGSASAAEPEAGNPSTLTVSGVSVGFTRVPSKRKRTVWGILPWRSQKASISFFSCVVRLILKKTSLLLSVTLMLRCSVCCPSPGAWPWPGLYGGGLPSMGSWSPMLCCR